MKLPLYLRLLHKFAVISEDFHAPWANYMWNKFCDAEWALLVRWRAEGKFN